MCCGVGFSTRALRDAFPDSEMIVGLDTSKEMISMAKFFTVHLKIFQPVIEYMSQTLAKTKKETPRYEKQPSASTTATTTTNTNSAPSSTSSAIFARGNAERTEFPCQSFDLVTVMYAFHEVPMAGREKILREAYRVLQPGGTLAVVDISTDYKPSKPMLAGEPYGTFNLSLLIFCYFEINKYPPNFVLLGCVDEYVHSNMLSLL
jgi:ubiquinone/menaquinone biosynthesis C-methylase UbiE